MNKLTAFLDSPSNRTGLCIIIGAIPPLATLLLTRNPEEIGIALAIGQVCSGILKILQPDNTVAIASKVVSASTTEHGDALVAPSPKT